MRAFEGKNITVFGLARSGLAAARRLALLGAKVMVSEVKPASEIDPKIIKELQKLKINLELGGHSLKAIESADLIVVSPGIHLDIPVLEEAKGKGIPIVSEIELAYKLLKKPIIAVTGTNGKTTTTTLIGELLKAGGKKVAVAGNIGAPLVEVDDSDLDYIVAEISSYQLETISEFKPWISVILNIQPDHLERHGSMEEYIRQKSRIFMNQNGDDYLVYNQDDPAVVKMVAGSKCQVAGFSKNSLEVIGLDPVEINIPGRHNLENSLAAANVADICGVDRAAVAEVLRTFPGVEHRIEFVSSTDGVDFYNDSKATNPDSTLVALETFSGRGLILILGGRDKGVALDALSKKVKQGVKAVILIGEATERFKQALEKSGYTDIHLASTMQEAVQASLRLANRDDIVLLSPACASFDMFKNFEERGRVFKEAVNKCKNLK
ncbi:MAG: UDP-N-acetylmuramoyl-L-alanine--D-glutamate ligase [Candidatus Margulisiibacteriota bacterium]